MGNRSNFSVFIIIFFIGSHASLRFPLIEQDVFFSSRYLFKRHYYEVTRRRTYDIQYLFFCDKVRHVLTRYHHQYTHGMQILEKGVSRYIFSLIFSAGGR